MLITLALRNVKDAGEAGRDRRVEGAAGSAVSVIGVASSSLTVVHYLAHLAQVNRTIADLQHVGGMAEFNQKFKLR